MRRHVTKVNRSVPRSVRYAHRVPYRVDLPTGGDSLLETLIDLGALDAERSGEAGVAAIMPDSLSPATLRQALRTRNLRISPALGRDSGSVWALTPRPVRVAGLEIAPVAVPADPDAIRLIDSAAFGTGLHPTTSLCLELLAAELSRGPVESMLDVGTGSGILGLAALRLGVPNVTGIDTDAEAVRAAAENARINQVADRLRLLHGDAHVITGTWPLAVANVLAAPLIEMASSLVRRIGHHGILVLSGIPTSVAPDVTNAYRRLGMRALQRTERGGWMALLFEASW